MVEDDVWCMMYDGWSVIVDGWKWMDHVGLFVDDGDASDAEFH